MSKDWNWRNSDARGKGALWGLVLALTLIGGDLDASARANASITLRVYNYSISHALLARAEREATAILDRAGVEVGWLDCPLNRADLENYPACQSAPGTADFAIKILTAGETEQFSTYREALGQALECPRNQAACSAYIFYRDVAREGDAAEYQLLGHALAHEIGHLLLGPNSHSATGIMRAKWGQQELQMIARAYLFFTAEQTEQIRKEVSARNAIQQDQIAGAGKP